MLHPRRSPSKAARPATVWFFFISCFVYLLIFFVGSGWKETFSFFILLLFFFGSATFSPSERCGPLTILLDLFSWPDSVCSWDSALKVKHIHIYILLLHFFKSTFPPERHGVELRRGESVQSAQCLSEAARRNLLQMKWGRVMNTQDVLIRTSWRFYCFNYCYFTSWWRSKCNWCLFHIKSIPPARRRARARVCVCVCARVCDCTKCLYSVCIAVCLWEGF